MVMKESNTNTIIPVYREGVYDRRYMMKLRAKAFLKEKGIALAHRTDLIFVEHRLTYN